MSHINVASTKAILGTFFGNIDAGNWSIAKDRLEMALNSDGHLVPLQRATTVPAMLTVNTFTKEGALDAAGWYNHQQTHGETKAKQEAIVKSAKAHLMMWVGQATYDTVKDLPADKQWAKLESVFAATSSTVDRSARLVKLVSMPQFIVGDNFKAWLGTFRATANAINNAVKHAQPSTEMCACDPLHPMIVWDWLCNLMPEAYAPTINALGDDLDIGKLEQALRRLALGDRTRRNQAQALVTCLNPAPASLAPLASRLLQRRTGSGPRHQPSKRTGHTGPYLDVHTLPNIAKWPPGVSKRGRLGLYPTQCFSCYKDGHLATACTVPGHFHLKLKADALKEYGIPVTMEQARALVHSTLTPDDHAKALAAQEQLAQIEDNDDEMMEASAASWHMRLSGEDTEQCLNANTAIPFLLNSGATRHMMTRLDLLHHYCLFPADCRVCVTSAFGSGGFASGIGSLRFPTGGKDMVLRNVLHVPGLKGELVSLHCLIEDGYGVRIASAPEALQDLRPLPEVL